MSDEEVIDLYALKVTELKAELRARSIPVSGTKAELIERLEKYMQEHEGVEVVEEDVYAEQQIKSTVIPQPKTDTNGKIDQKTNKEKTTETETEISMNSPPPVNSISTNEEEDEFAENAGENLTNDVKPNLTSNEINTMSETDRKSARMNRFSDTSIDSVGDKNKKQSRAERFGSKQAESADSSDSTSALKRRAERFNLKATNGTESSSNKVSKSSSESEKLKSRAERFGVGGSINKSDDILAVRKARFGLA